MYIGWFVSEIISFIIEYGDIKFMNVNNPLFIIS